MEYLYRLANSTKEYWKVPEISDEKEIKKIFLDYIKQFKYKIKLLIIYLGKSVDNNCDNNDNGNEDNNIEDESKENEDIEEDINIGEKSKINLNLNNNIINCSDKELNDSGFRNELFIDLFSCNEINVHFYVITNKYLYAKLFNKKMNYIFIKYDFLSDKVVKVLLFHDKKISTHNSNNNISNNSNKNTKPIIISTRGFLPEFKKTKITIKGSTSYTLSLSSNEDCLDNSVILQKME